MILSIVTINRNNVSGLKKTLQSVLTQTRTDFEYIVIDGASTDGSVDVISQFSNAFEDRIKWISEPAKGIYNAMNKGIRMASGQYLEFLNSGDCLASNDVVDKMYKALEENDYPSILYGNMLRDMPGGRILRDRCFAGQEITFLSFYVGTLNHPPTYIRRALFDKYGLYDESLKIVSDWKWFLQAILYGSEKPAYADIDVALFDMNGISENNKGLDKAERRKVLAERVPAPILEDYARWSIPILRIKRLKRHPWADKLVWLLERCFFKLERRKCRRNNESSLL